jgi:hypothetical protein
MAHARLPDIQMNNRDLLDLSADRADALLKANDPPFLFEVQQNGHQIKPVAVHSDNLVSISEPLDACVRRRTQPQGPDPSIQA